MVGMSDKDLQNGQKDDQDDSESRQSAIDTAMPADVSQESLENGAAPNNVFHAMVHIVVLLVGVGSGPVHLFKACHFACVSMI